MKGCKYQKSNGDRCQRAIIDGSHCCVLHGGTFNLSSRRILVETTKAIRELIKSKDGNWEGFSFTFPIKLQAETLDFNINISDSTFSSVSLENCNFEEIKLNRCVFQNMVDLSATRFQSLNATHSIFKDSTQLKDLNVSGLTSFAQSVFEEDFVISGKLDGQSSFNEAVFKSKAHFSAYRKLTISAQQVEVAVSSFSSFVQVGHPTAMDKLRFSWFKLRGEFNKQYTKAFKSLKHKSGKWFSRVKSSGKKLRNMFPYSENGVEEKTLFYGHTSFYAVSFDKPSLVRFHNVDLSTTDFMHVDVRGIVFTGCNWYQKSLSRNGVYNEVHLNNPDYHARRKFLPLIESVSRNLRHAMEENKNYSLANDFFVGEMEAKRKQLSLSKRHVTSLLAWYKVLSNYGTSPYQCIKMLFMTALLHAALLAWLTLPPMSWDLFSAPLEQGFELLSDSGKRLMYSLQVMTLRKDRIMSFENSGVAVELIDFIASILGPILSLALGLSIRTRIKR